MAKEDNISAKSRKESVLNRLRERHPDGAFDDEEALYGQIDDDYNDYDNSLNEYREREQQMSDMFVKDPRNAEFLLSMRDGGDPVVEMVRRYGDDFVNALEDPDKAEALAEANKEYLARVAENDRLEEEYQNNLAESIANIDAYKDENGLSDDEVNEAMTMLFGIVRDGIVGKFTPESVSLAMKAINHDSDVAAADYNAEVRGKNAKIEEKLRKRNAGDGLAALEGSNNVANKPRNRSLFDTAADAR